MAVGRFPSPGPFGALAICLALSFAPARADDPPAPQASPSQQDRIDAEKKAAEAAVDKAKTVGPAQIALRDQGALALPAHMAFVGQPEAGRLLKAYGNSDGDTLVGLVIPEAADADWWATLEFIPAGYVKDDDAKTWKTEELLTQIKEGTLAANEDRKARGFPSLEVTGWYEAPAYDSPTHRLVWSAVVRAIGAGANSEQGVNYNTYALGRDGYFSLDMIAPPKGLTQDKPVAKALLAAIAYDKGKGYDDFNASTDHIAEYGLAALVGGVALHKLGLFALGAVFALKFIKVIGIAAVALLVGVRRFFFGGAKRKPPAQGPGA